MSGAAIFLQTKTHGNRNHVPATVPHRGGFYAGKRDFRRDFVFISYRRFRLSCAILLCHAKTPAHIAHRVFAGSAVFCPALFILSSSIVRRGRVILFTVRILRAAETCP